MAAAADVRDFYAELGIPLPAGSGADVSVRCFANPGAHRHEDREPSCSVSVESGAWHCFACSARGGAYDAAVALGRDPARAMDALRRHGLVDDDRGGAGANGRQPAGPAGSSTTGRPRQGERPSSPAPSELDFDRYRAALDDRARQRLGELRGWAGEAVQALGLGLDRGRVVFPVRDATGALAGMLRYEPDPARRNGTAKMLAAKGTPRELFPPPEQVKGDTVWLVEGEPDAVSGATLGLPAVGVPGVEGWRAEWARRFAGRRVVVCFDCDGPGREAAGAHAGALAAAGVEVHVLDLDPERDDGYDIGELLVEASADGPAGMICARDLLDRMAEGAERLRPRSAVGDGKGSARDGWPEPAPLEVASCPEFPLDALPGVLRDWTQATATATQTPPALAAGMALATLSTAALGAAEVECGPGWREELALWVVCVLPSGERKSAVLCPAAAPLHDLERELIAEAKPVVARARAEHEALDARRKALVRKVADGKADPDELGEVAARLEEQGDPVLPRLLADDATPEALAGLLAQHGAIGILAAESAFLDNLGGRYSDGRANLHLACQSYSGEATRIDRRGRDPEHLDRPLLALGLAVQPHVLARLAADESMREQGALARAVFLLPGTALGRRALDPAPVPEHVTAAYGQAIRRVAGLRHADRTDTTPAGRGSVGSVSTSHGVTLRLGADAQAAFRELRAAHEPRLDSQRGDLARLSAWANRHPGRVARIAGLLHLAEHDPATPIGSATVRAAVRIGECLTAHALAALDPEANSLRPTVGWLARNASPTVTVRELHRGALGARGEADLAHDLARRLEKLGYLRGLPDAGPGPQGGRPASPTYEVNPSVLGGDR